MFSVWNKLCDLQHIYGITIEICVPIHALYSIMDPIDVYSKPIPLWYTSLLWHRNSIEYEYAGRVVFCPGDCPFKSEPSPTYAHACGEVTSCAPAAKRSACVAPEVDLGECTLHSPPQKVNKAQPNLALKPRGDVTRNPKHGYQWPQKRTCGSQKLYKKKIYIYMNMFQNIRVESHCLSCCDKESFLTYTFRLLMLGDNWFT